MWHRAVAYLRLISEADEKLLGKTCKYLLACMESDAHYAHVLAAGIVAGTVYVPTLDVFETLQKEGRDGVEQLAPFCQHVFEWSRALSEDAMPLLTKEVQLMEMDERRSRGWLDGALGEAAGYVRRGKHCVVHEVDACVKRLVEAGLRKFADVFHHHSRVYQKVPTDAQDAAWKRDGGRLAHMTNVQLNKCKNAFVTASTAESMQGARAARDKRARGASSRAS